MKLTTYGGTIVSLGTTQTLVQNLTTWKSLKGYMKLAEMTHFKL
jgi:hypothetical protein